MPTKAPAKPLSTPISQLDHIGPTRAAEFRARDVNTLGDLLEYFPRTYQQERGERPIADLQANQIQIARGEVVACVAAARGSLIPARW